jgi:hypothetical protein
VCESFAACTRPERTGEIVSAAASTKSRKVVADAACVEAVDLARAAAEEAAPGEVGEHLGAEAEGERVVTHRFACRNEAYRTWHWAVTVARASRAKYVTVNETVLLPGPEAVLAPEWVPWSERLRPGDLGPGDSLPTPEDDDRLEPGLAVDAAPDEAAGLLATELGQRPDPVVDEILYDDLA